MSDHAFLACSGASIWGYCAAAPKAQAQFPEPEETEETREGTAVHWVIESVLTACKHGFTSSNAEDFIGVQAPNGVIITEEMSEGADEFIQEIVETCLKHKIPYSDLHVEERVTGGNTIHTENWGTPDCWVYARHISTLFLWDYKNGHRYVEVFENRQMVDYAALIMAELGINGLTDQTLKIDFCIVQPRCYHADGIVRHWQCVASDLRGLINILTSKAAEAMTDNPTITTGPHCRDCNARHACRGAQLAAMAAIDYELKLNGSINELPPEALGIELRMLERAQQAISARLDGLKEQVIATKKQVPGWMLKQGQGRQKWNKPTQEIIALGDMMSVDLRKPEDICTPKQAIKKGIDAAVINAYSFTPNTGLKLERDTGAIAKRIFSQPRG